VLGRDATMVQAFRAANDVLQGAVQGIADLIVRPGLINVDFADVRTVMSEMGMAMMGSGTARGDDRAMAAAEAAISNPLLDDINLSGACGILVNITAGPDFTMREFDEVGRTIEEFASEDATVVIGTVLDHDMQDEVRVTVVATGLNRGVAARQAAARERIEKIEAPRLRPVLVRNAPPAWPIDPVRARRRSGLPPAAKAASPGRPTAADGLPGHSGLPASPGRLRHAAWGCPAARAEPPPRPRSARSRNAVTVWPRSVAARVRRRLGFLPIAALA
jgi:cell division protein FtsZ